MYGTTPALGSGDGNVFKINVSTGAFKVVHSFKGGTDGANPFYGVIYQDGVLYGTTEEGGSPIGTCTISFPHGCGTIFSINLKTHVYTVLYFFGNDPNPTQVLPGALTYLSGTLYGTTAGGGANGAGSFFSIDPTTGDLKTLHSFDVADGAGPDPSLLYKNGLFYGTTEFGGKGCPNFGGCGVVFSIDPTTGAETVLHAFSSLKGGRAPESNLIYHAGSLIGDTYLGGDTQNFPRGEGVSFSINAKTGREKVLDAFVTRNQNYSVLTLVGDSVYIVLPPGGNGNGELDQLDLKTGQQTVLYTFTGGADGSDPVAPLTYHSGVFYGSTNTGANRGCFDNEGCGTVFKYVP